MHFLSNRLICVLVNCKKKKLLQRKVCAHKYKRVLIYYILDVYILYLSIVCVWIDEELVKVFKLVLLWSRVVQIKTL